MITKCACTDPTWCTCTGKRLAKDGAPVRVPLMMADSAPEQKPSTYPAVKLADGSSRTTFRDGTMAIEYAGGAGSVYFDVVGYPARSLSREQLAHQRTVQGGMSEIDALLSVRDELVDCEVAYRIAKADLQNAWRG